MAQFGEPVVGHISTLLRAWSDGDQSALERLTPIVFDEPHCLARRDMKRERLSSVTVMRDWSSATAWLYRELGGGTGDGFGSMEASR